MTAISLAIDLDQKEPKSGLSINLVLEISRKLDDEGYLKRYLIYALGEILLIVPGILPAVEPNSLNQNMIP